MRHVLLATLGLAAITCPGTALAQRGGRGPLFISPMGEPFRGDDPQAAWFDGADANHDGAITQAEFVADAMRFFKLLDRKGDGEIDPDDIDYYETVLAPEIRVGGTGAGPRMGGGRRRDGGNRGGIGGGRGDRGDGAAPPAGRQVRDLGGKQGAARFGYLDYPEPVIVADRNFNRGVDPDEFARAANERFAMLDTHHDGRLTQAELPTLHMPRFERRGDAPRIQPDMDQ